MLPVARGGGKQLCWFLLLWVQTCLDAPGVVQSNSVQTSLDPQMPKTSKGGDRSPPFWFRKVADPQFSAGVFSEKYSWLSAFCTALFGVRVARLLAAVWP